MQVSLPTQAVGMDAEGTIYTQGNRRERKGRKPMRGNGPRFESSSIQKEEGTSQEEKEFSRIEEKLGGCCLPKAKGRSVPK